MALVFTLTLTIVFPNTRTICLPMSIYKLCNVMTRASFYSTKKIKKLRLFETKVAKLQLFLTKVVKLHERICEVA